VEARPGDAAIAGAVWATVGAHSTLLQVSLSAAVCSGGGGGAAAGVGGGAATTATTLAAIQVATAWLGVLARLSAGGAGVMEAGCGADAPVGGALDADHCDALACRVFAHYAPQPRGSSSVSSSAVAPTAQQPAAPAPIAAGSHWWQAVAPVGEQQIADAAAPGAKGARGASVSTTAGANAGLAAARALLASGGEEVLCRPPPRPLAL
jgi:hypothetical protein